MMGEYSFKLPDLGEGIVQSEIAAIHVKVGDIIQEDHPLIDITTDKATVEIPSPVTGKVTLINGSPGDMIAVGSTLVVFDIEGDAKISKSAISIPPVPMPPVPIPRVPIPSVPIPPVSELTVPIPRVSQTGVLPAEGKCTASPAVRHRARDANILLSNVKGSGPKGRISHQDFDDFMAAQRAGAGALRLDKVRQKRTAIEEIPVIGIRRKIAEKMALSKSSIPHFSYVEEVDVTEVEKLRIFMNANRSEDQPKLPILAFVMTALVRAVEKFPDCNGHYNAEQGMITRFSAVHIGVATQTPHGLVVPVVRHAESLDIWDMTREMGQVTSVAREGKARRDMLIGSTVTVTSLGKMGGLVSTPIINYPELCIIGVNKIVPRPMVVHETEIQIRQMMNLSSSFDHRIVDGYVAALLIQYIKDLLEQPASLFIAGA